jgi:hypothetical protein
MHPNHRLDPSRTFRMRRTHNGSLSIQIELRTPLLVSATLAHTMRRALWLALTLSSACIPSVVGAPCSSDENCPVDQRCASTQTCELGARMAATGGGSAQHDGGPTGGGTAQTGGGSGQTGGGAGSTETLCSDGMDNDLDTFADCADPDCATQPCRLAVSACDVAERCNAGQCPPDVVAAATVVCRGDAGPCDATEFCDGLSADCPTDRFLAASTLCRAANDGGCDAPDSCTGTSAVCPDFLAPSGTVCRPASDGGCDVEEVCGGSSPMCPPDAFAPGTLECRPAGGVCDTPEKCSGTSSACPPNSFNSSAFVCRPSAGGCDSAESCTGSSAVCPTDVFMCPAQRYCSAGACVSQLAQGATCTDAAQCLSGFCVDSVCCDGSCTGPCKACNAAGVCVNAAVNTDPQLECGLLNCDGAGSCQGSCTGACSSSCKAAAFCSSAGTCTLDKLDGAACGAACECRSAACTTFFADVDGDGVGSNVTASFCGTVAPRGYAVKPGDCCDNDVNAFPGQMGFFASARGCGGFDYDCDGAEEKRYPVFNACQTVGACSTNTLNCLNANPGWGGPSAPPCGTTASYVARCTTTSPCGVFTCLACTMCSPQTTTITQACR